VIGAQNGTRNTWFCGAWMRNGFHEDGFASAVTVAEAMAERHLAAGGGMSAVLDHVAGRTFTGARGRSATPLPMASTIC
jgi:predicted NAD/FAD-binding protein